MEIIPLPAHPTPGEGPPVSIHPIFKNPLCKKSFFDNKSPFSRILLITGVMFLPVIFFTESAFGSHPINRTFNPLKAKAVAYY
jgi:predicted permease